jgi:hypothetical protein
MLNTVIFYFFFYFYLITERIFLISKFVFILVPVLFYVFWNECLANFAKNKIQMTLFCFEVDSDSILLYECNRGNKNVAMVYTSEK